MRRTILITLLLLLVAIETLTSAQTPTPKPTAKVTDEDAVIKVDSRLVVVPVSVTNAAGEPVLGLTAKDFTIFEEGRKQTIENTGDALSVSLEIALLFDVSASTGAMFKFQQETAAKFLKDVLRPEDRATIYTVGQKLSLVRDRDSADAATVAVRAIAPTREQTAFYDAVREATIELDRKAPEGRRKVLVVISDGDDTNSDGIIKAIWNAERKLVDNNTSGEKLREIRVKAREAAKLVEQTKVVKALQNSDAVFYSINPGGSSFELNQLSEFGQSNMQKFATETGGTAFLPKFSPIDTADPYQNQINTKRNTDILERIFRQLANELRAQYLIQYYSDTEYPTNRFVKVRVDVPNRTDLRLRARDGYFVKN